MNQFRKKPVVIEAKQATGTPESNREIIDWTRGCATPAFMDSEVQNCSAEHPDGFDYPVLKINTLEGTMTVKPGDWIIKGVKGEFYPCKPDIFAATYDAEPSPSNSSLPPHQQRVLDEKRELDEKLQKLTAFISSEKFTTIVQDEAERGRLVCQEETMKDYSAILAERIEAFDA